MDCAALDTEGNVWLASSNEGLVRYSPGCFASPNLAAGLTDMDINAVTAAGGRYYAAVNQGLLAFELWDGTVAVGTQDGLALIRGDKVVAFYDKDSGLETQSILCIAQAPNGTLLADSAGSGIYALDKARILAGETPHAAQYGTARGLTGSLRVNTCNYMVPDGSLYLATRNGVSVFDFREISAPMPPLVINSIRVDDRTYESPERLTLGSDARRMTIRFSALTYSGATDLCIGYQLVGFAKAKAYTVGSWLEAWMENYARVKLRPSTFKTSQGFLKNHIKPQIGNIPLAELTSLDLQRFYKHLLDGGRVDRIEAKKKPKGLAPKTVRNIHQMIGSAYNLAMPRIARRITKGLFSTVENSPFETPRERKGRQPLDPRTAHIKSPSQQPCD